MVSRVSSLLAVSLVLACAGRSAPESSRAPVEGAERDGGEVAEEAGRETEAGKDAAELDGPGALPEQGGDGRELPAPVEVPEAIPAELRTPAFSVSELVPGMLDSTVYGGMAQPDGGARSSRIVVGSLRFRLEVGPDPLKLAAVELFVRPVELSDGQDQRPAATACGGSNQTFDKWRPAGPVRPVDANAPLADNAVWDPLEAPADAALSVVITAHPAQFPGGRAPAGDFTYLLRITEAGGAERWVESPALRLEIRECHAP